MDRGLGRGDFLMSFLASIWPYVLNANPGKWWFLGAKYLRNAGHVVKNRETQIRTWGRKSSRSLKKWKLIFSGSWCRYLLRKVIKNTRFTTNDRTRNNFVFLVRSFVVNLVFLVIFLSKYAGQLPEKFHFRFLYWGGIFLNACTGITFWLSSTEPVVYQVFGWKMGHILGHSLQKHGVF